MNERVEVVPASIEHLDFAPPCGMRACDNRADYVAIGACGCKPLICSVCVSKKVKEGIDNPARDWSHPRCGARWGRGQWLDFVTLHPLGGAS